MGRLRTILLRLLVVVLAGAGALAVVLAAAYGLLQTEPGRAAAVPLIEKGLAAFGVDARLDGLTQLSIGRLRLARLVFLRDGTPWLDADGIDVVWQPSALLHDRLHILSFAVSRITLSRLPPSRTPLWQTVVADLRLPVTATIERLFVGRLSLGAAVLGTPASLGIEGRAAIDDDGNGSLRVDVRRRDAVGGYLSAHVDYALASRKLDLSLSLAEPRNGLVATLLGVPGRPALVASLTGAGSLDGWHGRIQGSAGGLVTVDSGVDLAFDTRLAVAVKGTADVVRVLPSALRGLAAPRVGFAVKAVWDPATDVTRITDARLTSDVAGVAIDGTLDGRHLTTKARLDVTIPDARVLDHLMAPGHAGSVAATVTLGGSIFRPTGHVEARLEGLSLHGVTAKQAILAATFATTGDGQVTTKGSAKLVGLAGMPAGVAGLVGGDGQAEWTGRISADGNVDIVSSRVGVKGGNLAVSGTVAADGTVDLAGSVTVPDLALLKGLLGMPVEGGASATGTFRSAGGQMRATVSAETQRLALPAAAPLARLLGPDVTAAADVEGEAGGGWRIDRLTLDGKGIAASGRLTLSPGFQRVNGGYRVRFPDLALVAAPVAGEATVTGTLGGPLTAPSAMGRVAAAALQVAGVSWRDLGIDYTVDNLLAQPRGTVNAEARSPWGAVTLRAVFAAAGNGRLAIRDLDVASLGSRLSGELTVDGRTRLAAGRLALAATDLKPWSAALGLPVAGTVSAKLALHAADGRQDVTLDIGGRDLGMTPSGGAAVAVHRLTAAAAIADVLGNPRVDGTVKLLGLARQSRRLATLEAHVTGSRDNLDFSLSAAGAAGTPVSVTAAGRLALGHGTVDLTLAKLAGTFHGRRIALSGPARFHGGAGRWAAQNVALHIGDGLVAGNASLSAQTLSLNARLSHLPLALANFFAPDHPVTGIVDGEVRLNGPPAAPAGSFHLATSGATVGVAGETLAVRGWADGTLKQGDLALKAGVEGPGKASVTFDGSLPVRIGVEPLAVGLAARGTLAATVRGKGELAALLGPFIPDPHRVAGKLDLKVTVAGPVSKPRADGFVRVSGGRYENIITGMVVRDIALDARVHDASLDIVQASGKAGNGRISVSGRVGLAPASGFAIDLAVKADKAAIVGRDDASAVASGEITLKGPLTALAVKGKVTVDSAELRLIDRLPPDVVTLKVVEINDGKPKPVAVRASPAASATVLDLTVSVPGRLFVRGRGLDSEWSGSLHVGGSMAAPRISGQLSPVRGQFSFAGKTFVLQQSSTVSFRNPSSMVPYLNITAQYSGQNFTATFTLTGPADDPKLKLSSVPQLPEDEIVSRLLFGSGVSHISVLEAAQLADTVASLSGHGSLNVMDAARRLLGVDVLQVTAGNQQSGPAVTAGRYLGKNVYVGVTQGTSPTSGKAKVQVEVTPHISVETVVGPTSGGELGARWKYDY